MGYLHPFWSPPLDMDIGGSVDARCSDFWWELNFVRFYSYIAEDCKVVSLNHIQLVPNVVGNRGLVPSEQKTCQHCCYMYLAFPRSCMSCNSRIVQSCERVSKEKFHLLKQWVWSTSPRSFSWTWSGIPEFRRYVQPIFREKLARLPSLKSCSTATGGLIFMFVVFPSLTSTEKLILHVFCAGTVRKIIKPHCPLWHGMRRPLIISSRKKKCQFHKSL